MIMVVLPDKCELLEKRLLELSAQLDNIDIAQSKSRVLERSQLRVQLCQEYIEISNRLRDLKAAIPDPAIPEAAPDHKKTRPSRGDVMVCGRTRLKLEEAIERTLSECAEPLRADEIAHIISHHEWVKEPSRSSYVDAVRGALQRHRDKLGIITVGLDRRCRRYWLIRRGPPQQQA
jgi:hypothetical protein